MALPDQFERVGIVLGSALLLALPTSALWAVIGDITGIGLAPVAWFIPGLVVGWGIAAGWLSVAYHAVWAFSIAGYLLTITGWVLTGLGFPPSNVGAGIAVWVGAMLASAGIVTIYRR